MFQLGLFETTYVWAVLSGNFFLSGWMLTGSVLAFATTGLVAVWWHYSNRKGAPTGFAWVFWAVCTVPTAFVAFGLVFELVVVFTVIWFLPVEVPVAVVFAIVYAIYRSQPGIKAQRVQKRKEESAPRPITSVAPPHGGSGTE